MMEENFPLKVFVRNVRKKIQLKFGPGSPLGCYYFLKIKLIFL